MFIREDPLNEIKNIFNIKELNYMEAREARETSYGTSSLLFNSEGRTIIIEFDRDDNYYYIYESGCFFIVESIVQLYTTNEETCLELDETIIKLPGKAFDFTKELVLLAMEKS